MIGEFKRSDSYNICACGFQSLSKRMTVSASWKKERAERILKVSEYLSLQEVNPSLAAGLSVQSQLLSTVVKC